MAKLGVYGVGVAAVLAMLASTSAIAQGGGATAGRVDRKFLGADLSFNGQFRLETAISTGYAAPSNQFGDPTNGIAIRRNAGNPATGWQTTLVPTDSLIGPGGIIPINTGVLPPTLGVSDIGGGGASDTFTRYVPARKNDLNYHVLRFEIQPTLRWGNFSLITRLRALYDPGELGYRDFDARDYADINGGFSSENSDQFDGKPSHLGYRVEGEENPLLFERSGRNYMVDLPAFFLQWTNGQSTVRVGNQSVAWGQLLFFRIMDVANGLDLRRHLFLDRAIEEFADERNSAPGIRITHQVTDQIQADAYALQFIPTILNNVNTPYNLVPSQFYVRDRYKQYGYDEKFNYGIRFKGEYGNYNLQAMFTRRYNPLGNIRWTKSDINKPLPSSNLLGLAFNRYCELALGSPLGQGCGPQLAQTAFEATPAGVFTAEEWFNYAGYIKLDALDGLSRAIDEFPAAQQILAQPIGDNANAANNQLDAFFIAAEGLHGHIERMYSPENIYGLGGGYVIDAEPGSLFDQMIINVEATYTTDRKHLNIDLAQSFGEKDEVQVGIVVEKYQRFSQSFPATYMLFQYLWQKEFDLAGLDLAGYGSENFSDQGIILNSDVPTSADPSITPGLPGGAHYVVLAALQPTNAYIFEYSIASLIDVQGGVLVQPAVQWKPRGNITMNLYYNYITDSAWGNNANDNLMSLLDFADEIGIRMGYQF